MNPARTIIRAVAFGTATVTAAALLAACGSSDDSSASGSSTTGAAAGAGGGMADTVAQLEKAHDAYTFPTDPIKGVSALAGKTVYYIPITQQAPQFGIIGDAMTEALDKAGVKVQVCNGNSNPSDINKCVGQATGAHAGAIVLDAIPYFLAGNTLDAARKAGIPVVVSNQIVDTKYPASADLAYTGDELGSAMLKASADWIIDDSDGKGSVLINVATDTPSSTAYGQAAEDELAAQCPDCKVTVNKISSANFGLVAPSTSSALLKNPGIQYVISEYDQFLQPTFGGVQQAGKTTAVKGVSSAAGLSGLQMIEGKQFLAADTGASSVFEGWSDADAVLRLMVKQPVPKYDIPVRLFTQDNIGDLTLTEDAQATGEWYGATDFGDSYLKLWGLS
jgi:ribose transport system substrate-binding protein